MNDTSEFHSKNALKSVSEICALQDTKQIQNAKRRDFVKNSGKLALASAVVGAMGATSLLANSGKTAQNSKANQNATNSNKGAKMLYTTLNTALKCLF